MRSNDSIDPSSYFIIIEKLYSNWGDHIDLDVFSGGLAIEPLRESMEKLSFGDKIDSFLFQLKY